MKKDSDSPQTQLLQSFNQTLREIYDVIFPSDCCLGEKQCKYRCYLLSFCIPFILMMMVYCSIGAYPFIGPNSPLVLDMNGQYVYFFANLRNIILGDNSLLYSWSRYLGGEFIGMYAYYLASPISWIVLLFPEDMITDAIFVMLVLKTGVCGLSMAVFLDEIYPTKTLNIVLFSTLYAFCAYNLAYMSNIMWMDGVMILPLLILGLEWLLTDKKYKLYTISLAIIILSNYYIGFMICIFVVLYMLHYFVAHDKDPTVRCYYLKSTLRVGAYSILSAAISAVIILPAYYSLQFGKTDYGNILHSHFEIRNLADLISKLFFGHCDTISPTGSPFVYCGVLTLLSFPLFFLSKNISLREKLGDAFLLTVLTVSMVIPEIDILWHGGQTPNWMNFRYSFIFCLVLIVSAYRGFSSIEQINFIFMPIIGGILIFCTVFISWLDYGERYSYVKTFDWNYNRFILIANLFLIIVLSIILWRYRTFLINCKAYDGSTIKRGSVICLTTCVLFEAYAARVLQNTALAMDVGYASRDSYVDFIRATKPVVNYLYQKDDGFYRMEKTFYRMVNDNMALDIRGISGSTSTVNSNTLDLLKRFGYSSSSYSSWYYGGNPVNDSLLGIKYLISDTDSIEKKQLSDFYDLIYEDEVNDRYVFENPFALSIAFTVNEDIFKIGNTLYCTPFETLNDVLKAATEQDTNVFGFLDVSVSDIVEDEHSREDIECGEHHTQSYICIGTGEPVYLYLPMYGNSDLHIFLNGGSVEFTVPPDCSAGIISLGNFEIGKTYEIVVYAGKNVLLPTHQQNNFYTLNIANLKSAVETIQKNQLDISSDCSETRISGTVTVTEEKPILFTTIPYDKNWNIYVDGESVQSTSALDSLIAVKLTPGEHEIVFRYRSSELIVGSIISLVGLIVFGSIVFLKRGSERRCSNKHTNI